MARSVTISHWLPILTRCPVNGLPDALYVSVTFKGYQLHELYAVRRRMRKALQWKKIYMEDAADEVLLAFPDAAVVRVSLATGRHVVTIVNEV